MDNVAKKLKDTIGGLTEILIVCNWIGNITGSRSSRLWH